MRLRYVLVFNFRSILSVCWERDTRRGGLPRRLLYFLPREHKSIQVGSCWAFAFGSLNASLSFLRAVFTRRRRFTWRDVNVRLDFSEERAALIVESEFSNKKEKKMKPLWKMEGGEYEMKLTCGLCLYVKSLSLGERGKMNSPCVFNKANIAEWSLRVFLSITYLSVILSWIMQILKTSALREASTTLSVHVEIFYRLYF